MRHLTVSGYGSFLGTTGERLIVSDKDGECWETPLSRLRSIRIEKPGISISGSLIVACAARGIRLYFVDWRGQSVATVSGTQQQSLATLREAQFDCIRTQKAVPIAAEIIHSKIRNQRAVLLYFGKYLNKSEPQNSQKLQSAAQDLGDKASRITDENLARCKGNWRNDLMGLEGVCATAYWQALGQSGLLPESFQKRQGRGATEVTNSALNYGYAILQSYVWSALDNAGFELYAGLLHTKRPGRASLVLDFMEEYRAWVVDRNIIKLRQQLASATALDQKLKKAISDAIDSTMEASINWKGRSLRLENVLQRQAYRLAASICGDKVYRGIRFKW